MNAWSILILFQLHKCSTYGRLPISGDSLDKSLDQVGKIVVGENVSKPEIVCT